MVSLSKKDTASNSNTFSFNFYEDYCKEKHEGAEKSTQTTTCASTKSPIIASGTSLDSSSAVASVTDKLPIPSGRYGRLVKNKSGHDSEKVYIEWEKSNHYSVPIRHVSDGKSEPIAYKEVTDIAATVKLQDSSEVVYIDLSDHYDLSSAFGPPNFDVDDLLKTLVFPLNPVDFVQDHLQGRRPLIVQGFASRLGRIASDIQQQQQPQTDDDDNDTSSDVPSSFHSLKKSRKRKRSGFGSSSQKTYGRFNIKNMLQDASHIVVWMKTRQGGKMQYIDAVPPQVAESCYEAGHALYFNPNVDMQRHYIRALLKDLGLDYIWTQLFPCPTDVGGDIEVFAIKGPHITPWHFDAQDNFTIQLRGLKKWTIVYDKEKGKGAASLQDPLTNYHPASINIQSQKIDRAYHALCGCYALPASPPPPTDGNKDRMVTTSFILRPGSVLYLPAGTWHQVQHLGNEAEEEEEEESLSLNFSLDSWRWSRLFSQQLGALIAPKALWRSRIQCPIMTDESSSSSSSSRPGNSHEETESITSKRQQLATQQMLTHLLEDFRTRLSQIDAQDFLPLSAFVKNRKGQAKVVSLLSQLPPRRRRKTDDVDDDEMESSSSSSSSCDDDEEEEGKEEISSSVAGQWQAQRGLKLYESSKEGLFSFTRNPLTSLTLPEMPARSSSSSPLDISTSTPPSTMIVYLHRGFALDLLVNHSTTTTTLHSVKIVLPSLLHPLLLKLAQLPPPSSSCSSSTTTTSIRELIPENQEGTQQAVLIRNLVGLLTYHGYLKPHLTTKDSPSEKV